MLRAREIAIAGFGLLLFSSTSSFAQVGRQCMPAVANPDMYRNCRIAVTPAGEVCRCGINPAATRLPPQSSRSDSGFPGEGLGGSVAPAFGGASAGVGGGFGGSGNAGTSGAGPSAGAGPSGGTGGTRSSTQDNAGIGNGFEGNDFAQASGSNTSWGDPDNPGRGSIASASKGENGNSAEAHSNAPGQNR